MSQAASGKRKVILCVDDDAFALSMLIRVLRQMPYDVVTANTPWKGLKLAHERLPDLILLDMTMPGMDGRQMCTGLKEMLGDVPIVFVTGRQDPELAIEAYELGAVHYIRKPFENDHLRDVVQFLIGDISDEEREQLMARL